MTEAEAGPERPARVGVAVPAAGSGHRMGGVCKAFLELCGEPVLLHALRPFLAEDRVVAVAVALASEDASSPPEWLTGLDPRLVVVCGGETRSQSVRCAIQALPNDVDVIAVHDAARPLVRGPLVTECLDLAFEGFGAVAGSPAQDTMKRVDAEAIVVDTPDRTSLWHAHTPQAFPAQILRLAYSDPTAEGTDDAALVERVGGSVKVKMVDAGWSNLKVTRPDDVPLAEAILRSRNQGSK